MFPIGDSRPSDSLREGHNDLPWQLLCFSGEVYLEPNPLQDLKSMRNGSQLLSPME